MASVRSWTTDVTEVSRWTPDDRGVVIWQRLPLRGIISNYYIMSDQPQDPSQDPSTQEITIPDNKPPTSAENQNLYAKLSDGAYGGKPVEGWDIDSSLSNQHRTVYHKDGKAVVAFRGTSLNNKKERYKDVGTDLLLGLGLKKLSTRFNNGKKTTDLAIQKYGRDSVSTTGHSMGGAISVYVHQKRGLDTHAFNPGVGADDLIKNGKHIASILPSDKLKSNAHLYYTKKDVIGGLAKHLKGGTHHVVKQIRKNAHSLNNFF